MLYSPRHAYVVFITEYISSWNDIIFKRLSATVAMIYEDLLQSGHLPSIDITDPTFHAMNNTFGYRLHTYNNNSYYELSEYLEKIRFVHYADHYVDAIESATVVLDTFPYGGTTITVVALVLLLLHLHLLYILSLSWLV